MISHLSSAVVLNMQRVGFRNVFLQVKDLCATILVVVFFLATFAYNLIYADNLFLLWFVQNLMHMLCEEGGCIPSLG